MSKRTLAACLKSIQEAHDAALAVAKGLYPPGTRVGVMLSSRQKNPSPGTIRGARINTCHFGDGTHAYVEIRVELDNAKSHRSRFQGVCPGAIRAEA